MRARTLLRLALLLMCTILGNMPAQAKIVAVVFDTSGSMGERYHLPSFGAGLLAATIDGRAGFDRLLAMNFEAYFNRFGDTLPNDRVLGEFEGPLSQSILSFKLTNKTGHQQMIDRLTVAFRANANTGTPFGPIEVMLDRVTREVEMSPDDEEIVFIVVSDGEYAPENVFAGGRHAPVMRSRFEAYRDRIVTAGSSLRAEYLFIDAGSNLRAIVEEQQVRDTLLSVFNGAQTGPGGEFIGSRFVTSADQLWEALKDIIASVADTDRSAQDAFIGYAGETINVESPLSISRVVIVSTAATDETPAARQSDTFGVAPTDRRQLQVRMPRGDRDFPLSPPRHGLVEHLWFQKPIPPGTYNVTFDALVDEDVFLLFETSSIIDLRVIDENDNEVVPEDDGSINLFLGRDYSFRSRITDGENNPQFVDLDLLPHNLTMQLSLNGPGAPGTRSMTIDRINDFGHITWRPRDLGEFTAFSRASAGILSPASDRVTLRVIDPTIDLAVTPLRSSTPCPTCGVGEVVSAVEPGQDEVQVGEFNVTSSGRLDGAVEFGELPSGFEIRGEDGRVVDPGSFIPFDARESRTFSVWRRGAVDPLLLAMGVAKMDIVVSPAGEWEGPPKTQPSAVLLSPPEMNLKLVAVTNPITPGQTDGLSIPGGELLLGQFAAQFSLVDVVLPPSQESIEGQVNVATNRLADRLVDFSLAVPDPVSVGFNALDVRPDSDFLCLCWIWIENAVLGTPRREVQVEYKAEVDGIILQKASATVPMEFDIGRNAGGSSCLLNFILLVVAYMLVRGIIALITTHRFPKGSRIEIVEPDERVRFVRIDKRNTVWLKAWFAAVIGNPNEKRVVEGLRFIATRNGALLDISRGNPNWQLERLGDTFAELRELQPKKTEFKIQWDDRFDSIAPPGRTLYLRKRRGS